jgi:hypothetical protein
MFEIFVGLVALAILYRLFPKRNKADSESSILPFLDEEFCSDDSKSENEFYDWAHDKNEDVRLTGKTPNDFVDNDGFEEIDDELIE